uniref:GIY-YIG endonuclease n=1 Tax=Orbilia dorsalia TaxID=661577 RepID=A0A411P226_9PEZI|nr:GIY-YIG endonuclease [Orbilia dorsalia]QBF58425.1 GIY-YIG endonuclease [Orbilia dorsalia]
MVFLSSSFFLLLKINKNLNKENRFIHSDNKPNGSPNSGKFPDPNNFIIIFSDVKASKRDIYKSLKNKSGVYNSNLIVTNSIFNKTNNIMSINYQSSLKNRYYSTISKRLDPNLVTGFVDGEGSFSVLIYKTTKLKVGWETQLVFNITLHSKDHDLLIQIRSFFGVGFIKSNKNHNSVSYTVTKLKDLVNVIIPHFNKYPLITQKITDFILFSSVVDLVKNKQHLNKEGLNKILAHKASMNKGLSTSLINSFTDIIPIERIKFQVTESLSPYWVAGFTSGEGSFYVALFKTDKYKIGYSVQLRFAIGQHSRDLFLIEKLVGFFGCGYLKPFSNKSAVCYVVTDINNILNIIIPFFKNNPVVGTKNLDFLDFCKIAYLIKDKAHLTESGLNQIKELVSGMNLKREHDSL